MANVSRPTPGPRAGAANVREVRALVTGGAGFIGSQVVAALTGGGHDVRVLDALVASAHGPDPELPELPPGVEVVLGDVRDPAALGLALRGVDVVLHQAALVGMGVDCSDAPRFVAHNDLGTAQLLAVMAERRVRRLVLASSMVVYGEGRYACAEHGQQPATQRAERDLAAGVFEPRCPRCRAPLSWAEVDESAPLDPRTFYAASKAAQEHLGSAWAIATGGCVTALRYHNVYGPGMPRDTPYSGVAAIFRSALEHGAAPQVHEDGRQTRDFVHVRDVAAANLLAAEAARGGVFNIGSGSPRTVGELAAELSSARGGPAPVVTGTYRLGDVRHVVASCRRAESELGYRATVGFAEGLGQFARAALRPSAQAAATTSSAAAAP